jgi:hypothetical protein
MLFLKEHLLSDYEWTNDPGNILFTGFPTRRIFDRSNGYQVLFIINALAPLLMTFSVEEGRQLEDLILTKLPLSTQSEKSVYEWLKSNKESIQTYGVPKAGFRVPGSEPSHNRQVSSYGSRVPGL